jgi:membrane-bound serine protease (ClpP class)
LGSPRRDRQADSFGFFQGRALRARLVVGTAGFEPATSASRTLRATKLRYVPMPDILLGRDAPGLRVRFQPMRRCGFFLLVLGVFALTNSAVAAPRPGRIEIIEVSGIVDGNVERAVVKGIASAERERAALVILEINSDGSVGAGRANHIASRVRDSRVPVATWIGPAGARARNGAALIWFAASVHTMAPGATVGPVATLDLRTRGDATQIPPVLEGFGVHGRVDATTTDVAKQMHWADMIAPSVSEVITGLDGRTVTVGGSTIKLGVDPRTSEVRLHKLDLLGRALHAAAQPSITYLLVLLGLVGMLFEAFHPSTGPAGVTGAFAMALAVYGLVVLGGSWLGLALIVAGIVGFAVDLRFQSLGAFTVAGFAALVAGSVLLFHGPWLRVPPLLIAGGVAGMTAFLLGAMTRVLRDLRLVASGQLQVRDAHEHGSDNGKGEHDGS